MGETPIIIIIDGMCLYDAPLCTVHYDDSPV